MTLGPHLLGRTPAPDDAHIVKHPMMIEAVPPQGIEVEIKRPTLSVYDQGQTPKCVGYSTSKVINWFNKYQFDPDWLYAQCKEIDGDPTGDGTNARFACDVLRTKGHWRVYNGKDVKAGPQLKHGIASNSWATTVDQIRSVFAAKPQPVLLGIDWYNAWFTPETKPTGSWLQPIAQAGSVAGGHEIGIWACSDHLQAFGLSNTWGAAWPDLVWVSYATVTSLLDAGGDACVITDLATR